MGSIMTKLEILNYLKNHYTYLKEKYDVEAIGLLGVTQEMKPKKTVI